VKDAKGYTGTYTRKNKENINNNSAKIIPPENIKIPEISKLFKNIFLKT
jgi:hypothetical protein